MAGEICEEVELFGICFAVGILIGIVYDSFRILRLLFRHRDLLVDLEDLIFWIVTAWLSFRTMFLYNQGALRGYAFLGMFLGFLVYLCTMSRLLLRLVKMGIPYWNRAKQAVRIPVRRAADALRKTLKNMAADVKMAVRGR